MVAFGLVQAFSGFRYDLTRGEIGFAPRVRGAFSSFWSVGGAWGVYARDAEGAETVEVLFGSLTLRRLAVSSSGPRLGGRPVPARRDGGALAFARPLRLRAGDTLRLRG